LKAIIEASNNKLRNENKLILDLDEDQEQLTILALFGLPSFN